LKGGFGFCEYNIINRLVDDVELVMIILKGDGSNGLPNPNQDLQIVSSLVVKRSLRHPLRNVIAMRQDTESHLQPFSPKPMMDDDRRQIK
jgi:hypothetical protein